MDSKRKIVFIEDVPKDQQRYSELLSKKEVLEVIPLWPPIDLDLSLISQKRPDLILIDYELTRADRDGKAAPYRGGTLATKIREEYSEYPVILLSRRSFIYEKYINAINELGSIDWIMFKEDVDKNPDLGINDLLSLINGFERLRKVENRNWEELMKCLNADESESEKLKEIPPPRLGESLRWRVPQVAKWILYTLFTYPGIFYDRLYAAAKLGIDASSFDNGRFSEIFKPARYDGVFARLSDYWWRDRLLRIAFRYIPKDKMALPLASCFAEEFKRVEGVSLKTSRCIVSGEEHADTICYILKKPVKRRFTLEYYPDDRPSIMEPARVSFKAIKESLEFKEEFLSPEGRKVLEELEKVT